MNENTRQLVREHIIAAMDRKIEHLTITNPFNEEEVYERNPIGARIVPTEVWKGSKFERSFVTTLGQGIFEQIGRIIAEGTGAYAENQYSSTVTLNTFQTQTIEQTVDRQATGRRTATPDISAEIQHLRTLNYDATVNVSVISDLFIRRQDGTEEFYSFKTVKPNKDQTAAAKKNLLYLRTANTNNYAYFALPYNPAGEGRSYMQQKHKIPAKFFDMDDTDFVLVGSTLWNQIGNDPNTYTELLDIFEEVGQHTSERIRREYFGL
ncbi:TdeIII family type II restriction endonuclease [Oceanobacillus salinisoli]|uniref:TdeIII family type II restriction endonuclease n=1 Tax=Oceanobacillus salinisoli TaxID=2678611 RepID=UPI0012E302F3|nr:TdeIII family type II restriction endonuclease [Oceanobacillus salinisoli]